MVHILYQAYDDSMFCPEGHFTAHVNSHNSLIPCGYKLTMREERESVPNFRRQRAGWDQHCGVWFQRLEYISRVFENRHVKVQELPGTLWPHMHVSSDSTLRKCPSMWSIWRSGNSGVVFICWCGWQRQKIVWHLTSKRRVHFWIFEQWKMSFLLVLLFLS